MKSYKELKSLIPAVLCIAVLILDGRKAIEGAQAGLELCMHTVIPSLFPFVFLSSILTESLLSLSYRSKTILSKLFRIPPGADGILLAGLLGGYPVGARCIGEAVTSGRLAPEEAKRMLVFCNAAGPAFLFGITGTIFKNPFLTWILWGIHLFSAICIAWLISPRTSCISVSDTIPRSSIAQRLRKSVQGMGEICGWIILMRTATTILQCRILWFFSEPLQIFITGILEISSGCISLMELDRTGLQFVFCSVFLGFGGICVALQTGSVAAGVSQRMYWPGKGLQALISFAAAYTVQLFILEDSQKLQLPWMYLMALAIIFGIIIYSTFSTKIYGRNLESIGV